MVVFDLKTFANVAGGGGDIVQAVGTSFGVPSCMLNLASDLLKLLPSPVLNGMRDTMINGAGLADDVVKGVFSKIFGDLGIIEWDTENGGFVFISNSSKLGNDSNSFLGEVGSFLNAAGQIASFGGRLYQNIEAGINQVKGVIDCIKSFHDYLRHTGGLAPIQDRFPNPQAYEDYVNGAYAIEKQQVNDALRFIEDCNTQIGEIDAILESRSADPTLEPTFTCDLYQFVSGTNLAFYCPVPGEPQQDVFRLVYGPPKSTFGQFILSNDGLYFDSQTSGLSPALLHLGEKNRRFPDADRWKFFQDPNIGGRGKGFSTNDLKLYVNTVLDPDKINDSPYLNDYYDKDGFLQELIGTRNKRIYDLSSQLQDLITDDAPVSVITNFKQSIISENALLTQKINKRKKQIELAIVLPGTYGLQSPYVPGTIPVNDFSYLAGLNISIDIQKQKALSFSQVDISGVVSPIELKNVYVVPKVNTKNSNLDHLIIAENGTGAIIHDGSSVSSTNAVILDAENSLTTDGLFAMYNFLDTHIEDPSSVAFLARNSASQSDEYYCQLVTDSQSYAFARGLGIPYLHGITKNSSTSPTTPSGLGSYIRLPITSLTSNARPFDDFLYNRNGASVDFWVHVPNLLSISEGYDIGDTSGLYRLVLANENVGFNGTTSSTSTEYLQNNFSTNTVRGFIMGFSRDRRLTSQLPASNTTDDNPTQNSVFFIAPTQSANASSAGLINRSFYDSGDCSQLTTKYHSMVFPVSSTVNGKSFSSCDSDLCHIAVTFDPKNDKISFYLDGTLMTTSSMSYVFGIEPYSMPNLPTFCVQENSFEYGPTTVGPSAPNSLKYGPKWESHSNIRKYVTPWIVGGGYTDGMYGKGNFMGGTYGGIISGLKGYIGSFKMYSKPLEAGEVLNNYKAQMNFFKNVDTLELGWEPILNS